MSENIISNDKDENREDATKISPMENKILEVLRDGMEHTRDELLLCLGDPESTYRNLYVRIAYLRRKLRPFNQDIINRRAAGYRWVQISTLPHE